MSSIGGGGRSLAITAGAAAGLLALTAGAPAQAPKIGDAPEAKNMRLVGYSDLQARSAYQPIIHKQGSRYIAYIGHHGGTQGVPKPVNPLNGQAEFNGTSVIDVTDPKQPKYLTHIPGLEGLGEAGGGQMVRACDGKTLPKGDPNKTYLLRTFGGQGHEMWDVTDPAAPKLITRISWDLKDTHKSWWECDTGIAYLVSGVPTWRTRRMTEVYDLSDPTKPVKIRDFGLTGQQPGATGTVPTELHGMISTGPQGNRIYFAYGTNKGGVMQIVDREKLLNGPKEPTPDNLRYPVIGQLDMLPLNGAHTVIPLGKMKIAEFAKDLAGGNRDMIMIVDESLVNECQANEPARWCGSSTPRWSRGRWWCRTTTCVKRAGISAPAAAASAPIRRTRAPRRCFIRSSRSSPGSMPAFAPSTSATRTARRRSAISSRRSPRRPPSAASRSTARTAARPRSRATTWRPTTAATSMWLIAPIPACTSWS
jgi:hypothetical protein